MVGGRPRKLDVSAQWLRSARRAAASTFTAATALSLLLAGCATTAESASEKAPAGLTGTSPNPSAIPKTNLTALATDLNSPADLTITPDGTVLIAAGNQILRYRADEPLTEVIHDLPATGAPGIIDLALAPDFPTDPKLYICYRTDTDIRVLPLTLSADLTSAKLDSALLTGLPLPLDPSDIGCQIGFDSDGLLYVGTSDGGDPNAPQSLTSAGGKILRLDPETAAPPTGNPFADRSLDPITKLIYSYGHRSITGMAWHPVSHLLYAIDRGPGREDEINLIVAGGNYGWNPASRSSTSYATDGVPMTDLAIGSARPAAYSSGNSSQRMGSATFVAGLQWGQFDSDLAVSNLTGPRLLFMHVTGEVIGQPMTLDSVPPIGATSALEQHPNGSLLALTSEDGPDRLIEVRVVS